MGPFADWNAVRQPKLRMTVDSAKPNANNSPADRTKYLVFSAQLAQHTGRVNTSWEYGMVVYPPFAARTAHVRGGITSKLPRLHWLALPRA